MGVEESSVVDCSVGTIVWVRRRNGSWWPGRILGSDELSASHLMSPRSGTPVKLLGRDDASVDWYNLEKSKRVKAFRCGEFDACIQRAEASLGIPIKKREKYARREDAILHALELEKQQLETKHPSHAASYNQMLLRKSALSCERESKGDTSYDYKGRTSTSKSSLAIKRKRTQDGNSEDSLVKKRDRRRRPLVQVLQSSARLPASHPFQPENDTGDSSDSSELAEETESDSPETDSLTPLSRVSDWHMKGKRNVRNLTKRPFDLTYRNTSLKGRMGFSDYDSSDDETGPTLIDVEIQVQKQSYQREHVPWVSLSSKWSGGKPILGHPIQIEKLEDGSTYDAPPAFTRTAKRSVGTKKTRALSSFAAADKKPSRRDDGVFDGLMKLEGGIPLVTCVPVRVVFSRILEAVGRSRGIL